MIDRDFSHVKLDQFDGLELKVKDCSLTYVNKYFPKELISLCGQILECIDITNRKFTTIDLFLADYRVGESSCVDPAWHTDGKPGAGNEYYMFQLGGHRTLFKIDGSDREIPEGVLLSYGSSDVHRGRIFKYNDRRLMVRVCLSDYIKPRNKRF